MSPFELRVSKKTFNLETRAKKKRNILTQNFAISKNPQCLSNQTDIQATLPTHELVIVTTFNKNWQEIMDFLVIANF